MYENHAFGDASIRWSDERFAAPAPGHREIDAMRAWLGEGAQRLVASVRALGDDGELDGDRRTHWGEMLPALAIIGIVIKHDIYHAGEINHLRAIAQRNDRWP